MSNRPSLDRKHTRSSKAKVSNSLDVGYQFEDFDGTHLIVKVGDVTGLHEARLIQETGLDVMEFMTSIGKMNTLALARLVWFARLHNGVEVDSVDSVLAEIRYADADRLDVVGDDNDDDDAEGEPSGPKP